MPHLVITPRHILNVIAQELTEIAHRDCDYETTEAHFVALQEEADSFLGWNLDRSHQPGMGGEVSFRLTHDDGGSAILTWTPCVDDGKFVIGEVTP
jgi:hypothetical protein